MKPLRRKSDKKAVVLTAFESNGVNDDTYHLTRYLKESRTVWSEVIGNAYLQYTWQLLIPSNNKRIVMLKLEEVWAKTHQSAVSTLWHRFEYSPKAVCFPIGWNLSCKQLVAATCSKRNVRWEYWQNERDMGSISCCFGVYRMTRGWLPTSKP